MRLLVIALVVSLLVALPGCVDQKGQISQETKQDIKELVRDALSSLPSPTINVPPNEVVDTSALRENIRQEIKASADNNASQMTGAINTSVNKLANDITGVKAELGKLIEVNNSLYATLNSNITASMTNTAQVNADIKSNIQAMSKIVAELEVKVNVVNQMSADFEANMKVLNEMKAQLGLQAQAVAGIANKVENLSNTAGRDVNMLPMSAVYMVVAIILVLAVLASMAISWSFKASMDKAAMEAQEDRDESRRLHGLLMKALAVLPDRHAVPIVRELGGEQNATNQTPQA